jgi:hypothetical protein
MPCSVELLKVDTPVAHFYEFESVRRTRRGCWPDRHPQRGSPCCLWATRGFARGEVLGLRWPDVDLRRKELIIEQALWRTTVGTPKSGHCRIVPMTRALAFVHQRRRGERVLNRGDGQPMTDKILGPWIIAAIRLAELAASPGMLHVFRHSFCSHLAMMGAPAKAIQELAGHSDLGTTLGYTHLSPAARGQAIDLLKHRGDPPGRAQAWRDCGDQATETCNFLYFHDNQVEAPGIESGPTVSSGAFAGTQRSSSAPRLANEGVHPGATKPEPSEAALIAAIKAALDAGRYERAAALFDVLRSSEPVRGEVVRLRPAPGSN